MNIIIIINLLEIMHSKNQQTKQKNKQTNKQNKNTNHAFEF